MEFRSQDPAGTSDHLSASTGLPSPTSERVELRSPEPGERSALLDWLDDGLRGGRRGRLVAEYPTALEPGGANAHLISTVDGRFAAHALARIIDVTAAGRSLALGAIGLVYADPHFRGKGLASACVSACADWLGRRGARLAALWSDLHDFYSRLGFEPAGREVLYGITARHCQYARRGLADGYRTREPGRGDWPALEALYASKPSRALRPAGELRRLAAAPDCRLLVARRGDEIAAYAALGRGDDFAGAVHEWAGETGGVLACLAALLEDRDELYCLTGPGEEPPVTRLAAAGAVAYPGCFALVRLLDPDGLWAELTRGLPSLESTRLRSGAGGYLLETGGGAVRLSHGEALRLVLGPGPPQSARALLADATDGGDRGPLPWPLFIWGFDSV